MKKTIGMIGLGLIGGSMAKAIKQNTGHTVYGLDKNPKTVNSALEQKTIDAFLSDQNLKDCDIIILALYPRDTMQYVKDNLLKMKKGAVIIDSAGVKSRICQELSGLAASNGLYFVGGHPMAGTEKSGYEHAHAHLFDGATMIICCDEHTNIVAIKTAELLFKSMGFLNITVTTAEEHDKIIAFTSQLAHIVSSAYIKSPTALNQSGFSAGSYKDLTRVASLNETMWTELFLENKEHLIAEIEGIIVRLAEYQEALKANDRKSLQYLLQKGREAKEKIG
ncbi:MAG: prephenate dehydrogenase [Chloroflexi bacterium]|nr:prephenate dehydrogenase [Chloroflexota bacterium]